LVGAGTKTLSADVTVDTVNVQEGNLAIGSGATLTVGSNTTPSDENASETASGTITARANSGQAGTAKNVTVNADGITGATSGEGGALQKLGEMTGLTLEFTAAAAISNVTMRDVTLKADPATNGTVTYTNAKAVASTAEAAAAPALYAATATDMPETLTAMEVQQGGTASGTLTIDVTHELLRANAGKDLSWTIFNGVSLAADGSFTLVLGDILKTIVENGKPTVTLSGDWVSASGVGVSTNSEGKPSVVLTSNNLSNLSTGGLLAGSVTGGNLVLTIENVPEPTTGTLSVLALAALAVRRRRRK